MNILTKQYIKCLFNPGEFACMGDLHTKKAINVANLQFEDNEYVSINPIKEGFGRLASNVTSYRNFLFEIDEDFNKQKVSRETQATLIWQSGLPYSCCTWSGSKSYHWVVCLEESLEDPRLYRAYFEAVAAVLKKYGAKVDANCKDAARFTRAPFGINTKPELVKLEPDPEKRRQPVKKVRGRISRQQLDTWLKTNGIDEVKVIEPKPFVMSNPNMDSTRKFNLARKWSEKKGLYNPTWQSGGHNWLFLFGCNCYKLELDVNTAVALAIVEWGSQYMTSAAGKQDISIPIQAGWNHASKHSK